MVNELKARVVAVPPAVTGQGQRGQWTRQTVVCEYESGRYTQQIAFECNGNKAEEFGKLRVGQTVTIKYDVTSREYNGRWYTTANAFEWTVEGGQRPAAAPASAPAAPAAAPASNGGGADDLPF